jgi:hypothetical protein
MNTGTILGATLVVLSCAIGCGGATPPADTASSAASGAPAGGGAGAAAGTNATSAGPGSGPASGAGAGSSASSATGTGAASAGATAGSTTATATAGATAPKERPFANNALEAQNLIQEQIDGHIKPLWKCVADYRAKKGDAHKALLIDIGIDQEGNLLGVTTPNPKKSDIDQATRDCMMAVLHGLPFPRSHAGVITVRQTFSDMTVQP